MNISSADSHDIIIYYFICDVIIYVIYDIIMHISLLQRLAGDIAELPPSDDGVSLFRPHKRPVNCTEFSPYNNHLLYSCCYDGTLRRCDMNNQVFTLVSIVLPQSRLPPQLRLLP